MLSATFDETAPPQPYLSSAKRPSCRLARIETMISSPGCMQLELSTNKVPLKLYRLIGQLPSYLGYTVVCLA